MIDLSHGSGAQYGANLRDMSIANQINDAINDALLRRNRAQKARRYVSTSGLGRECLRQIQFDYLSAPKDEGGDFGPGTLRIFDAGHRLEDVVAEWLRWAGFTLLTHDQAGRQFGFSRLDGRFRGHIDGVLMAGPADIAYPALWENKALGVKSWQDTMKRGVTLSKPVYAAQMALYQAYLDLPNPAIFTAINRDTWEIHAEAVPFDRDLAQRMSDRAVDIVRMSDAGETAPRVASNRNSVMCKGGRAASGFVGRCAWYDTCWGAP